MSKSFDAITAACDLLYGPVVERKASGDFPGADYDRWKTASDREGELEQTELRSCGPCDRGEHLACWSEPPNKPYWYRCLCRGRNHRDH